MLIASIWGFLSKILDAIIKIFTIPLIVTYFGKEQYGLFVLLISLNSYLLILDGGLNVGSVRFFSIWIQKEQWDKIRNVSGSSLTFYTIIGVVNGLVLFVLSFYGRELFGIPNNQQDTYSFLLKISAIITIFQWASNIVLQLLMADNQVSWVNKMNTLTSFLGFIIVIVVLFFELSISTYFILTSLTLFITLPLNISRLKSFKVSIKDLLMPTWKWKYFKEVAVYSSAIFVMGIFQHTATNIRPLLLSKFSTDGIAVLTDFKILQTFSLFILALSGVFMQVLLPTVSKSFAKGETEKTNQLIYRSTKFISIFLSALIFASSLCSEELLIIYVGLDYKKLAIWLVIWLVTILIGSHNTPVASLVLATGKTKFLVYSSAIAMTISIVATIILAPIYNVGGAIIGYLIYTLIQIAFYYLYYIPNILHLSTYELLIKSLVPTTLVGSFVLLIVSLFTENYMQSDNVYALLFTKLIIFSILFVTIHYLFIFDKSEIKALIKKSEKH